MEVSTENIELLEKDLSSRLRYNVKGVVSARVSLNIPNGESFFTEKEMNIDVELIGINTYGDISVAYSEDYDCGSDDCDECPVSDCSEMKENPCFNPLEKYAKTLATK